MLLTFQDILQEILNASPITPERRAAYAMVCYALDILGGIRPQSLDSPLLFESEYSAQEKRRIAIVRSAIAQLAQEDT